MFILEFKRSTDREASFLEKKEAEADKQHKSILQALRAAVPTGWEFEQINHVTCNCGSVIESDFYAKLQKNGVQERKKNKKIAHHIYISSKYAKNMIE